MVCVALAAIQMLCYNAFNDFAEPDVGACLGDFGVVALPSLFCVFLLCLSLLLCRLLSCNCFVPSWRLAFALCHPERRHVPPQFIPNRPTLRDRPVFAFIRLAGAIRSLLTTVDESYVTAVLALIKDNLNIEDAAEAVSECPWPRFRCPPSWCACTDFAPVALSSNAPAFLAVGWSLGRLLRALLHPLPLIWPFVCALVCRLPDGGVGLPALDHLPRGCDLRLAAFAPSVCATYRFCHMRFFVGFIGLLPSRVLCVVSACLLAAFRFGVACFHALH